MTVVGSDQHPFEGESFACEGILYDEKGPRCGLDATARVHQVPVKPPEKAPDGDSARDRGDGVSQRYREYVQQSDSLAEMHDALTDLGMQYAAQTMVMLRAKRERDASARRLRAATELLEFAMHLRLHDEFDKRDVTWAVFEQRCGQYLRDVEGLAMTAPAAEAPARYVRLSGGSTVKVGALAGQPQARHGFVPDAWTGTSCMACFGWVSDPQHAFHRLPAGTGTRKHGETPRRIGQDGTNP